MNISRSRMVITTLVFLCCGLVHCGSSLFGQDRGLVIVPKEKKHALLIGVNSYPKPISSLEYCVPDMELLADTLEKIGFRKDNIILMVDDSSQTEYRPTKTNIERQFDNLLGTVLDDSMIFIAFSGHGASKDGESFLCPGDTDPERVDTMISRQWITEKLKDSSAKHRIFLVDACRNELVAGGKSVNGAKSLETGWGELPGVYQLSSCSEKQQSWEDTKLKHGVFTHFFVTGMSDSASDKNNDGNIDLMELFEYTRDKTVKHVKDLFNKPQLPTFKLTGELSIPIVLASIGVDQKIPTPNGKEKDRELADKYANTAKTLLASKEFDKALRAINHALSLFPNDPGYKAIKKQIEGGRKTVDVVPPWVPGPAGDKKVLSIKGIDYSFRWCPAGSFLMGSLAGEEGRSLDGNSDETQHNVTLSKGFWLLETEVTQGMWKSVMGTDIKDQAKKGSSATTLYGEGENIPIYYVSWNDCQEFIKKLNAMGIAPTGLKFSLPTEAQWEYACRAGTTSSLNSGRNITNITKCLNLDDVGWYESNSNKSVKNVGQKPPNAWGLRDMHGNVCEWCLDRYGDYPKGGVIDPEGASGGTVRGGSSFNLARKCRSATRYSYTSGTRERDTGFRIALVP